MVRAPSVAQCLPCQETPLMHPSTRHAALRAAAKALRAHALDIFGHPREWIKAAGYWTRGQADASDKSLDG